MDLVDTITAVGTELGRKLHTDELVIIGRLREAGKSYTEIARIIGDRPPEVPDSELHTTRAEIINRQVKVID